MYVDIWVWERWQQRNIWYFSSCVLLFSSTLVIWQWVDVLQDREGFHPGFALKHARAKECCWIFSAPDKSGNFSWKSTQKNYATKQTQHTDALSSPPCRSERRTTSEQITSVFLTLSSQQHSQKRRRFLFAEQWTKEKQRSLLTHHGSAHDTQRWFKKQVQARSEDQVSVPWGTKLGTDQRKKGRAAPALRADLLLHLGLLHLSYNCASNLFWSYYRWSSVQGKVKIQSPLEV